MSCIQGGAGFLQFSTWPTIILHSITDMGWHATLRVANEFKLPLSLAHLRIYSIATRSPVRFLEFLFMYRAISNSFPFRIKTPKLRNQSLSKIQLKNGLNCVIISDPETPITSAALSIEAGSWMDGKYHHADQI
jgi:hypothetical protein